MDKSRAPVDSGVASGQHEGRGNDRTLHPQAHTDSLGQGGLAGSKVSGGQHDVTGVELGGQRGSEGVHGLGGGDDEAGGQHTHPVVTVTLIGGAGSGLHAGDDEDARLQVGGDLLGSLDEGRGDVVVGNGQDEISDLGMTTVVDEMGQAGGRGATACRNSDAPGQPGGHGRLVKVESARQVSGFLGSCDREFRGHVLRARLFIHKGSG